MAKLGTSAKTITAAIRTVLDFPAIACACHPLRHPRRKGRVSTSSSPMYWCTGHKVSAFQLFTVSQTCFAKPNRYLYTSDNFLRISLQLGRWSYERLPWRSMAFKLNDRVR